MILDELVNLIGFKIDFGPLDRLQSQMDSLKSNIQVTATVAAGQAAAMFGLAASATNAADEYQTLAHQTGASTDQIQKFLYAAESVGTPLDNASEGLRTFTETIADAVGGGGAGKDVFKDLNIELEEIGESGQKKIRPTMDIFLEFADSINKLEDPSKRFFYIKELMQEDGAQMTNFLRLGSDGFKNLAQEAQEFNLVMSDNELDQMRKYSVEISRFKTIGRSFINQMGREITPVFVEFINSIGLSNTETRKAMSDGIVAFFKALQPLAQGVAETIREFVMWLPQFIENMGGAEKISQKIITLFKVLIGLKLASFILSAAKSLRLYTLDAFKFVASVRAQDGALGDSMIKFRKMTLRARALAASINAVTAAQWLSRLGWAGLVAAAAAGLIAISQDIYTFFQGGESVTGQFVNFISESVEKISGYLSELWQAFSRTELGSAFINFFESVVSLVSTVSSIAFAKMRESIDDAFLWIEDKLIYLDNLTGGMVSKVLNTISTVVSGAKSLIMEIIRSIGSEISEAFSYVTEFFNGPVFSRISGWLSGLLNESAEQIQRLKADLENQNAPGLISGGSVAGLKHLQSLTNPEKTVSNITNASKNITKKNDFHVTNTYQIKSDKPAEIVEESSDRFQESLENFIRQSALDAEDEEI